MAVTQEAWDDFLTVLRGSERAKTLVKGELRSVLEASKAIQTGILDDAEKVSAMRPAINQCPLIDVPGAKVLFKKLEDLLEYLQTHGYMDL